MNGDMALLSTYLWIFLILALIFMVLAPFLIWKNTANTNVILRYLLEEQERTTDLLALLVKERGQADCPAPAAAPAKPADDTVTESSLDPADPKDGEFIMEEN